jgi:thiamine-phosphate pyrophosphorylase
VQLREKDLPGRPLLALAERLRALTAPAGALLLVNDRVDVAIAAGADGVHLGGGAMPVAAARRLLPAGALVGVSTHSAGELSAAAVAGADFAFFGPVYETPSKTGPPQDEQGLRVAVAGAALPVLAIGGVSAGRVAGLRAAGAAGVAVIRAILSSDDPRTATRQLLAALA